MIPMRVLGADTLVTGLEAAAIGIVRHQDRRGVGGCEVRVEAPDHQHGDGAPRSWAPMNAGTDAGAIPANVLENMRPIVIAGLAKLAELVKKYAAPM